MPRILSKIIVRVQISFKALVLPSECLKYRIDVDQLENVIIDVLAGNLYYKKQNVLVSEGLLLNDELLIVFLKHSDNDESSLNDDYFDDKEENNDTMEIIDLSAIEN
ncbi:15534_t:CDS:2 [Cetraspora pellucida]|uniref:15534_t:CDS:1 n=1 Tax=Cetraspora pellucida TaxID=1433469 RepID=A0ACA9L0U2_9GLOM|nr:15534_t:CDS:2 [Cetraspora pellucida]